MKIGVDIGGTFMDFCAYDAQTSEIFSLKVLTTPDHPGRELEQGLTQLHDRFGVNPEAVDGFVHGTTVGINTIIQRKGCRLALITNRGFEDVIELARLRMPDVYSLFSTRPATLIAREDVFGISGRMDAHGMPTEPLDQDDLATTIRAVVATGVEGVIVSLLHAYRNPAQEMAVKEMLELLAPDIFVFTSSEVWPVIREYERSTTAILNGYVHPRIAGYLSSLEDTLVRVGVTARPLLTKSNGGVMNVAAGKTNCVSMLLSGTASGVIGAAFVAKQAGVANVLTLDIGGTSADLALIIDDAPQYGTGEKIGEFPLYVPSVSVTSIGAGGGSIAWVDRIGVLKVGPESAGSTPGPACYGLGGEQPTVTDAMAVCGYIGQAPMAFGQINVDSERARAAVAPLAAQLGLEIEQTAAAIIDVAVSEMFVEVNRLIARYGVDERDFALMPFGGAGPMLGAFLAREIGLDRVLIPHRPGVISALGGLVADLKGDFIQTVFDVLSADILPGLAELIEGLRQKADTWLRHEQGYEGPQRYAVSGDMRYAGQSHEIEVLFEDHWIAERDIEAMRAAFHRAHEGLFGFADPSAKIEMINLRLVVFGQTETPVFTPSDPVIKPAIAPQHFPVWSDGSPLDVPFFDRAMLLAGHHFDGPAVVTQDDTTICIPSGFSAQVDGHLNLILRRETGQGL